MDATPARSQGWMDALKGAPAASYSMGGFFFFPTNIWIVLVFRRLLGLKGKKKTKLRYTAFYYIKTRCHFFVCAINTPSLFI